MKNKIYHLGTCSTCQRIIKTLNDGEGFIMQDIKKEPITNEQLEEMKAAAGSYEALFSRRAMKYRAMGLHEKDLGEDDFRDLILQEYTFLSRPVIFIDGKIFVGNSKKNIEAAKKELGL